MRVRGAVSVAGLGVVVMLTTGASSCGAGGGGGPAGPAASDAAAGAQASAASTSAPIVALGTAMVDSKGRITVVRFEPHVVSDNEFERPAAGTECVQVTVRFADGSGEQWSLPTSELSAVDSHGEKYDTFAIGCPSGDSVDGLVAGGAAQARVAFEVPAGVPLNLSWQPNPFEPEVYQTVLR